MTRVGVGWDLPVLQKKHNDIFVVVNGVYQNLSKKIPVLMMLEKTIITSPAWLTEIAASAGVFLRGRAGHL